MGNANVTFGVFTKPWKGKTLDELGEFVAGMGFDEVELPVRNGFNVEPDNIATDLPKAAKTLEKHGVKIASIAGPIEGDSIPACEEAGVRIIRICVRIKNETYAECEQRFHGLFEEALPKLDKHGVAIGIQNHCGNHVTDAIGIMHLIEKYDPKHVCAVWDAGHSGLAGEEMEQAIDICWSHMRMVNLKNAFRKRMNGPEALEAEWKPYWTNGCQGFASWSRAATELKRRGYKGPVCLTAEYSDEESVDRLIQDDLDYAKSLFD